MSGQREEQAHHRRRDRQIIVITAVALVIALVGGAIGVQAWRTSRAPSAEPAPSMPASGFAPVTITDGKPIVLGRAGAPVTIRLFEDFRCPHCADFEASFGPTISAAQNAGTVAVALYPMAFVDQGSTSAANAMACAAEAGFGQPYYAGLFANHTLQWSNRQLVSLADQVTGGKTPDSFRSCVEQGKHLGWVDSINSAADAAGVQQTPTVFIGDSEVDTGTLTVDKLNQLIADGA